MMEDANRLEPGEVCLTIKADGRIEVRHHAVPGLHETTPEMEKAMAVIAFLRDKDLYDQVLSRVKSEVRALGARRGQA